MRAVLQREYLQLLTVLGVGICMLKPGVLSTVYTDLIDDYLLRH